MRGAFQISREIFESDIWEDIPKFRIFFYILGNAVFSHEGVKKGSIVVKRGQYLRSYRNLCRDLEYVENRSAKKYSTSVVKRKVDQLVKEERLKIEDTELGTLFTVVNYEKYQDLNNYKSSNLEQNENRDGTERERRKNNNKNDKNVKNEKERIPYAAIVDHLNEKTGKNYKPAARKTRELIQARWNEGYSLEDFKKVIDVCSQKWKGKTFSNGVYGDEYLRPSTLFNGKFDERLNWSLDDEKKVTMLDEWKSDSIKPDKSLFKISGDW